MATRTPPADFNAPTKLSASRRSRRRFRPVGPEALEARQMLSRDVELLPLNRLHAAKQIKPATAISLTVPGARGELVTVEFLHESRSAAYRNELGLYRVDDASGRIGGLRPGDRGYAQAVLKRAEHVLFKRTSPAGASVELSLRAGETYGYFLVQNGTLKQALSRSAARRPRVLSSFAEMNPGRFQHVRKLGGNRLAWEDMTHGGDRDFDDHVLRVVASRPPNFAPTVLITAPLNNPLSNHNLTITGRVADDRAVAQLRGTLQKQGAANSDVLTSIPFDPTTGAFSFPTTLSTNGGDDGSYTLTLIARDDQGLDSSPAVTSFVFDSLGPVISITEPTAELASNRNLTIRGVVTDNLSGVASMTVRVDEGAAGDLTFDPGTGSFEFTTSLPAGGSADGRHTIQFDAVDRATNAGQPASVSFVYDTVAPAVVIQSPDPNRATNVNVTIIGMATDLTTGVERVEAAIDAGAFGVITFNPTTHIYQYATTLPTDGSADGEHTVRVRGFDQVGNESAIASIAFTLDTRPPLVTLQLAPEDDTAPAGDNATYKELVRLVGQTEPNLTVLLVGTGRTTQADAQGNFQFDNVPLPTLGDFTFKAQATDAVGNVGEGPTTITRVEQCGFEEGLTGWTTRQTGGVNPGVGTVTAGDQRAILVEGNSFEVTLSRAFVVPQNPTTLKLEYDNLAFDTTNPSFINDAFEVALVGENGVSLVPTFTPGRDAFFNITEGLNVAFGSGVTIADQTVTVDVSQLIPGTNATVIFRLVNNDSDTATTVAITCVVGFAYGNTTTTTFVSNPRAFDRTFTPNTLLTSLTAPANYGGDAIPNAMDDAAIQGDDGPPSQTPLSDSLLDGGGRVTFTTSEDFVLGTPFNVNTTAEPDALSLNPGDAIRTFDFIWVANSGEGTISKFDTKTGKELGRYRTGPNNLASQLSPSRTTVDLNGNVWVGNRAFGIQASVVKVLQADFVDRNGNGVVDTSTDLNNNGRIEANELLPWDANSDGKPDDERIALSIPVGRNPNNTSQLINDRIARSMAIAPNGEVWVGLFNSKHYEAYEPTTGALRAIVATNGNPYGAVIDGKGILYGANRGSQLDRIDTNAREYLGLSASHGGDNYGITIDAKGIVWTATYNSRQLHRYDPAMNSFHTYGIPANGRGVGAAADGTIWVATNGPDLLVRYNFTDDFKLAGSPIQIHVGSTASAAVIDSDGFVWTTTYGDNKAWKIDPKTNAVAPGWPIATGSVPYNYSDMTGQAVVGVNRAGSWTEIIDGERPGVPWAGFLLDALAPDKTSAKLFARASDNRASLGSIPFKEVTSGARAAGIQGRFLELQVSFRALGTEVNPTVSELTAISVPPPSVTVAQPIIGGRADAGLALVLTGFASAAQPEIDPGVLTRNFITHVTVNGKPVDLLDGAGRFYSRVSILPGDNTFDVVATDLYGQTATASITVEGVQRAPGEVDFSLLADITASFQGEYARTSYKKDDRVLFADTAVRNIGNYPIDAPLYVAIENISVPSVAALNPHGYTPSGAPYYDVTGLVPNRRLAPEQLTGFLPFSFANPTEEQFRYDLRFFGLLNRVPLITTVPEIEAAVGRSYAYDVNATDPDNDTVTYHLMTRPEGMTINTATGEIAWSPDDTVLGNHPVTVRVEDGRGGFTEQRYDVTVIVAPPNRPPVFTSLPVAEAHVGGHYLYDADAVDPDVDPLEYALIAGPEGMSINAQTGLVSWTPTAAQRNPGEGSTSPPDPSLPVAPGFDVTLYANVTDPSGLSFDPLGTLYVGRDNSGSGGGTADAVRIHRVQPGGSLVGEYGSAPIGDPDGVLFDPTGVVSGVPGSVLVAGEVVGAAGAGAISAILPDGTVRTVAGPSLEIGNASLFGFDGKGRVIFDSFNTRCVSAYANGTITTLFTEPTILQGLAIDGNDRIFTIGSDGRIRVHAADGSLVSASFATGFGPESRIIFGPGGVWGTDLYVADSATGQFVRLDAVGHATVVATGMPQRNGGMTFGPDGSLYVAQFDQDRIIRTAPSRAMLGLDGGEHRVVLAASDGRGGVATQEYTICVTEAPGNHAPVIVSQPVTQIAMPSPELGDPEVFDLSRWTVIQYMNEPTSPDANWVIENGGTVARQVHNAEASILLSDAENVGYRIEGTWRVNEASDDDYVGFVFGYQDPSHYYIFEWKQADQASGDPALDLLRRGMRVRAIAADTPLTRVDIYNSNNPGRVRTLFEDNSLGWSDFTDYRYTLDFTPGSIAIAIHQATTLVREIVLEDDTFTSGRFGFYNNSQEQVIYTGFQRRALPQATYHYDVEAIDPDPTDTLTYTLASGPQGMTIDPNTGALSWPAGHGDVGTHSITVRVEDGRGGFDEQSFAIEVSAAGGEIRGTVRDSGTPGIVAESTFDAGLDGWTSAAPQNLSWRGTGGNPGGQLYFADRTYRHPLVSAPGEFLGDWSTLDGTGRIEYDQMLTYDGGRGGPFVFVAYQVYLAGTGGSASWTGATPTGLTSWQTITVPLIQDQWDVSQGTWTDLLRNIASFQIRVELVGNNDSGFDESGLDNFRLISGRGVGLTNWNVYLDQNQNGRLDSGEISTTTDANGTYAFTSLPAGTYVVAEEPQPGWVQILPESGTHTVVIGEGQVVTGIDFGNQQTGSTTNRDPILVPPPDDERSAESSTLYRLDAVASDPDGDPLTFSLPVAPTGMTVHPALGVVVWTPTSDQVGTQQVVLRVQDDQGGVAIQSFEINVAAGNSAPVVTSTPPGPATTSLPYVYQIQAQDAEGDALTYANEGALPLGLNLNTNTGRIDWTPGASQVGNHPLVILVRDGENETRHAFTLGVVATSNNLAPVVKIQARGKARVGQSYDAVIDAFDPNGDPLTLTLVAKPEGMSLDSTSGEISWAPAGNQLGTHHVEVLVSDARPGGDVTKSFQVEVLSATGNLAPRITSNPRLVATVDRPYASQLAGEDLDGDALFWSLDAAPRGMSIDPIRGTLRWTPTADQLGPQHITVRLVDTSLASHVQTFTVLVNCVNQAPAIVSRPPTVAFAGDLYVYAVRADDPDDDVLAFSLLTAPTGMTIDAAGVIRWVPAANQAIPTSVVIKVDDGQGNLATQAFTIAVTANPRNRPPVITSQPRATAGAETLYNYDVDARDPEGETLHYELIAKPSDGAMTIDENTGLISWTPGADDIGEHIVTVAAIDPANARALQTYVLKVAANEPPTIDSSPVETAIAGNPYRYDVRASDPNGDPLAYVLTTAPAGMAIDGVGRITWQPPADFLSQDPVPVALRVRDPKGLEATQSYTITVQPDTEAPRVSVAFSTNLANPGDTVRFRITATDNVRVETLKLTLGGEVLALDETGLATSMMTTPGVYPLVGTATDPAGNVGTWGPFDIRVFAPGDDAFPVVQIHSPDPAKPETTITYLTDIVGSVQDENLDYWQLAYARVDLVNLDQLVNVANPANDDPDWREIANGKTNVTNAKLGVFDPTMLLNGPYVIRLMARDVNGLIDSQGAIVNVAGEAKLGNFHLEFTDLQVPLAGIPITVTRVYDTLQATDEGDFGFGWTLDVQDARILEAAAFGEGGGLNSGNDKLIPDKSKVYLTNPEGRRVGFTYREQPTSFSFFGGIWRPYFTPDPGVYDTLTIDETEVARGGIVGDLLQGINPDVYTLTTKNGLRYRYDQFEGLQRVDEPNGAVVRFTDDGIFHSSGVSITFTRDYRGRITRIAQRDFQSTPVGEAIGYAYNAAGDLSVVTNQVKLSTTYKYYANPAHFLDEAFDPNGNRALKVIYENNRFVRVEDALGNPIDQRDYDLEARTAIVRDGNGNPTTLLYDTRGNVVRAEDPEGGTIRYAFGDSAHPELPTQIVDGRNFATVNAYDARGNLTSVADSFGTTQFVFNQANRLTRVTNPLGQSTTYEYDARRNLIAVVNAAGDRASNSYDTFGRRTNFTDFEGNTTTFAYGAGHQPTSIVNHDNTSKQITYSPMGMVTQLEDELGHVLRFTYDAAGRVRTVQDPEGGLTRYSYDRNLLVGVTDPLNRATQYEYDTAQRLISTINHEGMTTRFAYTGTGRIASLTDALGQTTAYEYDKTDQLIRRIDPTGKATIYGYDAVGNGTLLIDRNGRKRTFEYDAANRPTREFWWEGDSIVRTIDLAYNAAGNLLTASDPDAHYTFTYDAVGRATSVARDGAPDTPAIRLNFRYDANGNPIEIADDLGVSVVSTYEAMNHLNSRTWRGGGIDSARIEFEYGDNGLRAEVRRYSDANGSRLVSQTRTVYDRAGQVTGLMHLTALDEVLANYEYNYDEAGQLTRAIRDGLATDYLHDLAGQLTAVDNPNAPDESYRYDANGNRTLSSLHPAGYTLGANNRILSDGVFDYDYDFEGSLVRKTERASGLATSFTYDHRNRLLRVDRQDPDKSPLVTTTFSYDVFDRRIRKESDGVVTWTHYNGDNAWVDVDGSGQVQARYLFGDETDELLARYRPGEGTAWYLADELGSVRDLINASGGLVNQVAYDGFGNVVSQTNAAATDRFLFTGREFDVETGLYYYRARYYDPQIGRFTSEDPIGFDGGDSNLYRYAGNTPQSRVDPTGNAVIVEYTIRIRIIIGGTTPSPPASSGSSVRHPNLYEGLGAIIGFAHGFAVTNLIFIGEFLGDFDWDAAYDRTERQIGEINCRLKRAAGIAAGAKAPQVAAGFLGGYAGGVGYDVLSFLPEVIDIAVNLACGNVPNVLSAKRGGFDQGADYALRRLKNMDPPRP